MKKNIKLLIGLTSLLFAYSASATINLVGHWEGDTNILKELPNGSKKTERTCVEVQVLQNNSYIFVKRMIRPAGCPFEGYGYRFNAELIDEVIMVDGKSIGRATATSLEYEISELSQDSKSTDKYSLIRQGDVVRIKGDTTTTDINDPSKKWKTSIDAELPIYRDL